MKAVRFISVLIFLLINSSVILLSQQAINFQAVARGMSDEILAEKPIAVRFSIHQGTENNPAVYIETHVTTTNRYGLFSVEIGTGNPVIGTFEEIDWGVGDAYLGVEIDPNGGTDYREIGVNRINTVPFAKYADEVRNTDDADADPQNELQTLEVNGNELSISNGNAVTLPNTGGDAGDNWGTQTVASDSTLSGKGTLSDPLKISRRDAETGDIMQWDGNTWRPAKLQGDSWGDQTVATSETLEGDGTDEEPLKIAQLGAGVGDVMIWNGTTWLPGSKNDDDADSENELQSLSKEGLEISLSNEGGTVRDSIDDADNDPENELQEITITENTISLSKNGGEIELQEDNDWTNETEPAQHIKARSGGIVSNSATLYGENADTHINLGFGNSITGIEGENIYYATIGGGANNTASGDSSTVSGGTYNIASSRSSTVGGGFINTASESYSTVGGGGGNTASEHASTVGGGVNNTASGGSSTVGGGNSNTASFYYSTVGGGRENTASGYATVGGGRENTASGYATVGGGRENTASESYSTVGGGISNTASESYSTVGGGRKNTASGYASTVAGGGGETAADGNTASGEKSTVGGGFANYATEYSSTVGGGHNNTASGYHSTISGGKSNSASGYNSTVSGGYDNEASGVSSTVGGGGGYAAGFASSNTASGWYSTISGGRNNLASGDSSTVSGGYDNEASGNASTVGGGNGNTASGYASTISGGGNNLASGDSSTVSGGYDNEAKGKASTVGGGLKNTAGGTRTVIPGGSFLNLEGNGSFGFRGGEPSSEYTLSDDNTFYVVDADFSFNPRKQNVDFKVSSNKIDNIFFISGSKDIIGINRNPKGNMLEVEGRVSKTTAGDWLANSDRRIKSDIKSVSHAFDMILKLNPVTFRYSESYLSEHPSIEDRIYYNFIAQEYREVFPESVQGSGEYLDSGDEILQIDTYNAQIVTIKAVQELIKKNEEQRSMLSEQKDKIEGLITENEELEARLEKLESLINDKITEKR